MIPQFAVFIVGLILLWVGADLLLKYASRLASSLGVSPVIVGLSIVSVGTSAPELVVSIVAVIEKNGGMSIGNIVGSNIANIGLILGIGALLHPMEIRRSWIEREIPFLILVTLIFIGLAHVGLSLGFLDGIILLLMLVLFLFYLLHFSAKEMSELRVLGSQDFDKRPGEAYLGRRILFSVLTVIGALVLVAGSELTVSSGKKIAMHFGVSDLVIGLTLVAVGTSLPELATTIAAAVRKEMDIMVGNIIGSNIFNLLLIGGVVSLMDSIPIDPVLFHRQFPLLLFLSILLWPLMRLNFNLRRYEGLFLLVMYSVFLYLTI